MLGTLLAPVVVNNLGKLIGFHVCTAFLYGIQMIDPHRESTWYKKTKKLEKRAPVWAIN